MAVGHTLEPGYSFRHVLPVFERRPLALIRRGDVEAWVRGLELAPSTAQLALSHFRTMPGAAVDDGYLATNPRRGRSTSGRARRQWCP